MQFRALRLIVHVFRISFGIRDFALCEPYYKGCKNNTTKQKEM